MCFLQLASCDFVAVMQKPVGLQKLADEILSWKDTALLKDILGVEKFLKTAKASGLSISMWKTDKQKFSPPAMGSGNLGRGGVVALANMMQQSSCTTLFQGRGKRLQTWMSSAAGFLLFSKCFWRCCSWTFRASPDPRMPWKQRVMQYFRHLLLRTKGINDERIQVCGWRWRWLHGVFVQFPCLSCCSTHGTGGCHDPLKDYRPHQIILRSSIGFLNIYCLSKLVVSRCCVTFHFHWNLACMIQGLC